MTVRHVVVSLAAVACLAACGSDDTIVALNVTATDQVPAVSRLQVTLTQGSRKLVHKFEPPSETSTPAEGEEPQISIKNGFFQRITLPDDWQDAPAKLEVEAFADDGEAFDPPLVDETTVRIEPSEVVAAYVKLDIPEDPPPGGHGGEGGAAGAAGGESSVGGAGGAGGVESGGASFGGEPGSAGAAGDGASGGATGGVGGAG